MLAPRSSALSQRIPCHLPQARAVLEASSCAHNRVDKQLSPAIPPSPIVATTPQIMTDPPPKTLSPQNPSPVHVVPAATPGPPAKDEIPAKVESVEEEPYTIKCICNFSDDDGNTIYCETCDTWQHIECFYPDNREEAIREDFSHSCADCKPRPLNRQKAIERALQLRNGSLAERAEKKQKRPPSKSHKKKPKPADPQANGAGENAKHGSLSDHAPSSKKPKSSHRTSHSVSSQPSKRSPSYSNFRSNPAHPPSPATSPPDLPDDFQIHHYSAGFYALYNEHNVPDTHNNAFASLAIPTAMSRWLRDPETMRQEVGRTHADVFQDASPSIETKTPKLEVKDILLTIDSGKKLRWRFLKSPTSVEKDEPLIELNGEIGFQKDYCSDPDNLWGDLSSPLPFVFFHPVLPLYIDTRKEGSMARYVRRSCKPNAQLDTYLHGSEYHFWLVSDRYIAANEQITLPWDFRLEKSVGPRWLHLLGLSDDEPPNRAEPEMDETEYVAISNWIDRILSEYGGCACELENNCAFARFHRHYLHGKGAVRANGNKKKQRKPRPQTISPTSTGHVSRAASEGHGEDGAELDMVSQSGSRSKPSSRDPTPVRQGSLDQPGILTEPTDRDKRKVAMVEDSFRRMEQQQPPRKKKRVSDGTTSSSKSRRHHGQYVDAGAGRSKSGSPATVNSPTFPDGFKTPRQQSVFDRSRQTSASPRPVYCDAGIQTDPVEGEWFSAPVPPAKPKKRVISLAKRLMDSRKRYRADEEQRKQRTLTSQASSEPAMEVDSPVMARPPVLGDNADKKPPGTSQPNGVHMMIDSSADAPASSTTEENTTSPDLTRPPDLRVQMPPVPTFDHVGTTTSSATTPLSATSTMAQSPFSTGLGTPFGPPTTNGAAAHPSPVKKKLSLSDYTKRSKAAGKAPAGPPVLKQTLSSPEEPRADMTAEGQTAKTEPGMAPSATALDGH